MYKQKHIQTHKQLKVTQCSKLQKKKVKKHSYHPNIKTKALKHIDKK